LGKAPTRRSVDPNPRSGRRITVLLADDHEIVRQGLRALLAAESDIAVVGEAPDGRRAVKMALVLRPDVVVLDVAMPRLNGLEATRQILDALPTTRVVVLSAHSDDEYIQRAAELGAAGYLFKQASLAVLAEAIRHAHAGAAFVGPSIAERVRGPETAAVPSPADAERAMPRLTSREAEVLQLIVEGKANKQTAAELGISIKTVEKHRQSLMTKLDIHDVAGLTHYAIAKGIVVVAGRRAAY
jgi:DNA-binding NarL/FixJ family response regulator